jgi:molybdopterin synthase sulfur carrier subunit
MKIKILAFGIARDIVGGFDTVLDLPEGALVADVRQSLTAQFPDFQKLTSLKLAVNSEYAADDLILTANDEIVIIPPVSGG